MACNLGTFTVLRTGTSSQTVAIGRFEIESSCSVFRLNYLKSRGRKKLQYIPLFFVVGNYVAGIEKFNHIISCIFNQQLELLNFNYLGYFGAATLITFIVNESRFRYINKIEAFVF